MGTDKNPSANILTLDADPSFLASLCRKLHAFRRCLPLTSSADALDQLADPPALCGAIVSLTTDARALDVLTELRRSHRRVPVVVLTDDADDWLLERCYDLDAQPLPKRALARNLTAFAIRCVAADLDEHESVRDALSTYAFEHSLGALDLELIHAAIEDRRAEWFAEHHGIPRSTYKFRVGSLLDKTGEPTLASVALTVLRQGLRARATP